MLFALLLLTAILIGLVWEATMTLDDLKSQVTAMQGVVDSVVTLLNGLHAKLDAALASGDPAKIQEISDALKAEADALAAAVAANDDDPNT